MNLLLTALFLISISITDIDCLKFPSSYNHNYAKRSHATKKSELDISILKKVSIAITSFVICVCPLYATATSYDTYSNYYDNLNGADIAATLGVNRLRQQASKFAAGNLFEVSIGTGLQLPYYDWQNIKSFTAVDQSQGMIKKALLKAAKIIPNDIPRSFKVMDATKLEFPDHSFDSVVDTFSFCVYDNPKAALEELKRVVNPDGRIILVENTRSDNIVMGAYQDLTDPILVSFSKGCHWNIDIKKLAANTHLDLIYEEKEDFGTLSLTVYKIK